MTAYPDGIDAGNESPHPVRHVLNWLSFALLLALLAVALSGALGGSSRPVTTADAPAAALSVKAPAVIRNGMFFEVAVDVAARRAIAKPVLAVSESYWRDITINTTEPQAASEKSERGMFLFEYDAMKPGDVLRVKFDGQINPSLFGGTAGRIELRDDKTPIASIPLQTRVLP
jgi:hypothetical protein